MSDEEKTGISWSDRVTFPPHDPTLTLMVAKDAILTFKADGTMEIGKGLKPDEAGRIALLAMATVFRELIERAKKDEREACAQIADDLATDDEPFIPGAIATTIRARK